MTSVLINTTDYATPFLTQFIWTSLSKYISQLIKLIASQEISRNLEKSKAKTDKMKIEIIDPDKLKT